MKDYGPRDYTFFVEYIAGKYVVTNMLNANWCATVVSPKTVAATLCTTDKEEDVNKLAKYLEVAAKTGELTWQR